jgi:hypothetical protein
VLYGEETPWTGLGINMWIQFLRAAYKMSSLWAARFMGRLQI